MDSVGADLSPACKRPPATAARGCPSRSRSIRLSGSAWRSAFPACSIWQRGVKRAQALIARYRHHYLHDDTPSPLFAGASELLSGWRAQGIGLAIATGKSRRGLDRVLDETGSRPLFAASRGADEATPNPIPDVDEILDELGFARHQAVMIVGDSIHDMAMARPCRCPASASLGCS